MIRSVLVPLLLITTVNAHAMNIGHMFMEMASLPNHEGQSVDAVLAQVSEQQNRNLPRVLNEDKRLDKVIALPGQHFIRQYTILSDLSGKGSRTELNNSPQASLKNEICSDKSLAMFFKSGVLVTYQYQSQNGKEIGKIDVSPSDCKHKT
jgi:hypothetical protein